METKMLCNLRLGEIFHCAKGSEDLAIENCYWMKVAECLDNYGKYIGCRCVEVLTGSGEILDEEILDGNMEVVC
jgi:hypothetical protein